MTLKQVDESFTTADGKQSIAPNRSQDSRANRTVFGR
jgi:hypothetical protein